MTLVLRENFVQKLIFCFSIFLTLGFTLTPALLASQDHDEFSFEIQGDNNQRDNYRYRDSNDNTVPWSVYVSYSDECESDNCLTRFWLETKDGDNVAAPQVLGTYDRKTQRPYSKASNKNVYLTAEDNDVGTNSYTVEGDWDEEW